MPVVLDEAKMMERIAMLLRKAEATEFPDEAETASAQAEKLMIRLGIDRAAAMAAAFKKDGHVVDEPIIERRHDFDGTLSVLNARFLGAVVRAFGCRTTEHWYKGSAARHRGVVVYGHESTVEHAFVVWQSLRLQAEAALAHWANTDVGILRLKRLARESTYDRAYYQSQVRKARKSFLLNFAYGAAHRIRENRRVAEDEVKGTGTDLVLADREKAVDRYYEDATKGIGKSRDVDASGYGAGAGYRAGQAASTGERQFAGRRAIGGR